MYSFRFFYCLCIIAYCSSACKNSLEDINRIKLLEAGKVEQATDVLILYSDSAIVRMRIAAPIMRNTEVDNKPKREFPKGVKVDFFSAYQNQTSQLIANYAEYHEVDKQILLRDSIVLWNYKNERLETEELVWDERLGKIYSKKFVKITTPTEIIHGYGFSSNMEFTEWEIDSVSGIMEAKNLFDNQ